MNEIYLSSEAPLVVFISSVICGMEADREAARQAVASTTLSRPWAFEFTPPSSLPLDESYLSYARTCDIFVLLAGERESDAVTRELRTAIKHRRPILAYVRKGERIPADIQRLIHRVKYYAYGSLDELRAMIVNGIHDEIIRNHRSFVRLQPNEGTERQGHAAVRVRDFSPVMAYLTVGPEHSAAEELLQKTATMFGAELGLRPKRLSPRARDTEEICYASYEEAFQSLSLWSKLKTAMATSARQGQTWEEALKQEIPALLSRWVVQSALGQSGPHSEHTGIRYILLGVRPALAAELRACHLGLLLGRARTMRTEGATPLCFTDFLGLEFWLEMFERVQAVADDPQASLQVIAEAALRYRLAGERSGQRA